MKVKQATNAFKRNSLFLMVNIKVSFVALNQIRNDSKNERDFKRIVSGQFRNCCVHKIAHTPAHIVFCSGIEAGHKHKGLNKKKHSENCNFIMKKFFFDESSQ